MPSFVEERLNTEIRYGSTGGPEFNTEVVVLDSGAEARNSNWQDSRGAWVLASDIYNEAEKNSLLAFFRARKGRAEGFRFKDWSDYRADTSNGIVMVFVAGGVTTYWLYKRYTSGSTNQERKITKPLTGTVTIYRNGTLQAGATVNYTTGQVTPTDGSGSLTWSGEFDVPVRFDTDAFKADFVGHDDVSKENLYQITGLPIVELRLT